MIKKLKKKIKKVIIRFTKDVSHLKRNIKCNYTWFGQDFAGFFINPDYINESSIVYSFGIGQDVSFDTSLIDKFNCNVYGFDPTPKSINWIKNQHLPKKFKFFDFGIGVNTEDTFFFLPVDDENVSGSVENHVRVSENKKINVHMKSLRDVMTMLGHKKIDVLKMDIEGSEYEIIESLVKSEIEINQLVIEFHDRFFNTDIPKSIASLNLLKKQGYEVFAVSDSYEEVSFIRTSLLNP